MPTSSTQAIHNSARGKLYAALAVLTLTLLPLSAGAFSFGGSKCTPEGFSAEAAPDVTWLRSLGDDVEAPVDVAADGAGNVYTVDPGKGRLLRLNLLGNNTQTLDGLGTPSAVAIDAEGNVFVANSDDGSVGVYDNAGNLRYRLGQGAGEFMEPNDIAIDPDPGVDAVYVSDGKANLVKVYSRGGAYGFSFGGFGDAAGQFNFPSAVHVSAAGEVYVGDQNNDRIQVFDRAGALLRWFGADKPPGSWGNSCFGRIYGITTDSLGRVYVTDGFQGEIKVLDAGGAKIGVTGPAGSIVPFVIGSFGSEPGQFRTPTGIDIDPFNRLWVTSVNNGRREVFGIDPYEDPQALPAAVWVDPAAYDYPRPDRGMMVFLRVEGVDARDIDTSSIRANGQPTRRRSSRDWKLRDFDGDGLLEWRGKFNARQVLRGLGPGDVVVDVTGETADGLPIAGSATVIFADD